MAKKEIKVPSGQRFYPTDINNWQKAARRFAGGNLTKWMEQTLNAAYKKAFTNKKQNICK
jgi:hypothetical protein